MEALVDFTDRVRVYLSKIRVLSCLVSFVIILVFPSSGHTQGAPIGKSEKQRALILTGEVENISIEKGADTSLINIKLNLILKNDSSERVVFLDYPVLFPAGFLLASPANGQEERILATSYGGKACQSNASEWKLARKLLKNQRAPEKSISILEVGQQKMMSTEIRFIVANDSPSQHVTNAREVSLATLMKIESLSLKILAEVYPSWGIEPNCKAAKLEFGKTLRKRLKTFGYLWLGDVPSERIPIKLS